LLQQQKQNIWEAILLDITAEIWLFEVRDSGLQCLIMCVTSAVTIDPTKGPIVRVTDTLHSL